MEEDKILAGIDVLHRLIAKLTMNAKEILDKFAFYLQNPVEYVKSEYGEYLTFDEDEIEELLEDKEFRTVFPGDVMEGLLRVEKFMLKVDHRESPDGIEYAVNALLARKGLPELKLQLEKKGMNSYAF